MKLSMCVCKYTCVYIHMVRYFLHWSHTHTPFQVSLRSRAMRFLCERELARLTVGTQGEPYRYHTHTNAQCTNLVLLQVSYPHTIHTCTWARAQANSHEYTPAHAFRATRLEVGPPLVELKIQHFHSMFFKDMDYFFKKTFKN